MSEIRKVETEVKDIETLKEACAEVGIDCRMGSNALMVDGYRVTFQQDNQNGTWTATYDNTWERRAFEVLDKVIPKYKQLLLRKRSQVKRFGRLSTSETEKEIVMLIRR